MVSTLNLDEKFNRVRKNFCFYLDIQDHGLARSLSRRIQDMGLQQEVFLTSRVTHVVSGARCERRAGAMRAALPPPVAHLTVQKAISLLDKLYDTFFASSRKAHVTLFTKHFIKIEFLDKLCRPIYKEFDEWPEISIEPDPPREKKKDIPDKIPVTNQNTKETVSQKMTRKSRPRVKERGGGSAGGYCEMCNVRYVDAALHAAAAPHAAFVRDANNFLALDALIGARHVAAFLKAQRPRRNGTAPRNGTACLDTEYYKVVGVSTKLRSSGGFRRKESPPPEREEPLVVKFRKVRRSELSVLSDEAEQFMFPKRASSSSSTGEDEEPDAKELSARRKSPPPPPGAERRRQARPGALKEESSEEDSWPEDRRRRRKRPTPVVKRARRTPYKEPSAEPPPPVEAKPEPMEAAAPPPASPGAPAVASPQPEVPPERCMKWEDGRLKYTPAVEQLEFAFESVPHSEPWYETFKRQDNDKVLTKNVPQYFALYSKSPKLPYEIGQLPPLKPNCCPLSEVGRREEKAGPSRAYGTRGMKRQRIRKRTLGALVALDAHPRKSPREHASTLAMLSGGRPRPDDAKSSASEDTGSDSLSAPPAAAAAAAAADTLRAFLADVFEDAAEYDLSDELMEGEPAVPACAPPDVSSLLSESERCELELPAPRPRGRRGRTRKNRTGWPSKRRSRTSPATSLASGPARSVDRDLGPDDDDGDGDGDDSDTEKEDKPTVETSDGDTRDETLTEARTEADREATDEEEKETPEELAERRRVEEDKEVRRLRRALSGLGAGLGAGRGALGAEWLQPVVRVSRVATPPPRRLRSAARPAAGSPARPTAGAPARPAPRHTRHR